MKEKQAHECSVLEEKTWGILFCPNAKSSWESVHKAFCKDSSQAKPCMPRITELELFSCSLELELVTGKKRKLAL